MRFMPITIVIELQNGVGWAVNQRSGMPRFGLDDLYHK